MEIITNPLQAHVMSVSSLNLFAQSPAEYRQHILNPQKVDANYFTKGSAVDCLITEPDKFEEQFAIIKTTAPSGMLGDVCKLMNDYMQVNGDNLPEETLFKLAYQKSGFKLTEEAVWKKYKDPKVQQYMNFLKNSKGKTVISEGDFEQVKDVVAMLQNYSATKFYMKDCKSHPMMDVYDQLYIEFELEGLACKGTMDRVIVDHSNKRIIPTDLKTTGKSVLNFRDSFIRFGYFRQAAFYMEALRQWHKRTPSPENGPKNDISKYTIDPFKFIVAEMECVHQPVVYGCSVRDINMATHGGVLKNGEYVKGILELLKEVKWHRENDEWFTTYDHAMSYQNENCVVLDVFN
jgi:hypothetical protein